VEHVTVLRTISADQVEQHRELLCRWVEANGIDPKTVAIEEMTVETDGKQAVIRYQEIQRSPEGRSLIDPECSDRAWRIERTAPQLTDLDDFGYPQEAT
jgi:pyrroloquinoline quinone (PQQ) biosynthesis protein C